MQNVHSVFSRGNELTISWKIFSSQRDLARTFLNTSHDKISTRVWSGSGPILPKEFLELCDKKFFFHLQLKREDLRPGGRLLFARKFFQRIAKAGFYVSSFIRSFNEYRLSYAQLRRILIIGFFTSTQRLSLENECYEGAFYARHYVPPSIICTISPLKHHYALLSL